MTDSTFFLLAADAAAYPIAKEQIDVYLAALEEQSKALKWIADRFKWGELPKDAAFRLTLTREGLVENACIFSTPETLDAILRSSTVPMLRRPKTRWAGELVRVVAKGQPYRDFRAATRELGPIKDAPDLGRSIWFALGGQRVIEMFCRPAIQEVSLGALLFTCSAEWISWPALLESGGAKRLKGSEALKLIEDAEDATAREAVAR